MLLFFVVDLILKWKFVSMIIRKFKNIYFYDDLLMIFKNHLPFGNLCIFLKRFPADTRFDLPLQELYNLHILPNGPCPCQICVQLLSPSHFSLHVSSSVSWIFSIKLSFSHPNFTPCLINSYLQFWVHTESIHNSVYGYHLQE